MKVLVSEKLSEHKYKTPEGYLICTDAILARTGKQSYTKDELFQDGDNTEVDVDRPYDEVMNAKTIASFENKPITFDHPDEDVNVGNYKDYAIGYVRDVRQGKTDKGEDVILGNLVITDQDSINAIEQGDHTDLSCGYDCDIKDDGNGNYSQTNIRGNHLALCEQGRAGIAHIVDSKVKDSLSKEEKELCDYMLENALDDEDENDLLEKMKVYYYEYSNLARSKSNEVLQYFKSHINDSKVEDANWYVIFESRIGSYYTGNGWTSSSSNAKKYASLEKAKQAIIDYGITNNSQLIIIDNNGATCAETIRGRLKSYDSKVEDDARQVIQDLYSKLNNLFNTKLSKYDYYNNNDSAVGISGRNGKICFISVKRDVLVKDNPSKINNEIKALLNEAKSICSKYVDKKIEEDKTVYVGIAPSINFEAGNYRTTCGIYMKFDEINAINDSKINDWRPEEVRRFKVEKRGGGYGVYYKSQLVSKYSDYDKYEAEEELKRLRKYYYVDSKVEDFNYATSENEADITWNNKLYIGKKAGYNRFAVSKKSGSKYFEWGVYSPKELEQLHLIKDSAIEDDYSSFEKLRNDKQFMKKLASLAKDAKNIKQLRQWLTDNQYFNQLSNAEVKLLLKHELGIDLKDSNQSTLEDGYTYKLIKKKNDYDEYVVQAYKDGKKYEGATYYTDDWDDAIGTMRMIAKREKLNFRQQCSVYIADKKTVEFSDTNEAKEMTMSDAIKMLNIVDTYKKVRDASTDKWIIKNTGLAYEIWNQGKMVKKFPTKKLAIEWIHSRFPTDEITEDSTKDGRLWQTLTRKAKHR